MESKNIELIKQLQIGQVFKNYIEMCSLLDLEVKGGKGKLYQMMDIERYMKLKKQVRTFTVEEIYDEPLPKVDGRANNGENNNKYDDLMDNIIINLLICYGGKIEESYSNLMKYYFKFFTKEYEKLYNMGYTRYSQVNQMGKGVVGAYQQKMKDVLKTSLDTTLKRLKRNGIVEYAENIVVVDTKFARSYADPKMKKKIKDIEAKVYAELIMIPFDRGDPRKNRQFKNATCKYLHVNNYWNVYTIELLDKNTEHVEEDSNELIRRFIKSVEENTKNTKSKFLDDDGNRIKLYSYEKYESSIDKLTKLIWRLPEGHTTEYDFKQLLVGKVTDIKNRYKEYDDDEQANYGIPF